MIDRTRLFYDTKDLIDLKTKIHPSDKDDLDELIKLSRRVKNPVHIKDLPNSTLYGILNRAISS